MDIGNGSSLQDFGFSESVTSKILSQEALLQVLGSRPRTNSVVMCHGTFDLVHPGHLRHLAYARAKGEILVVSVTCDKYVTKANMRPYVPEDLRALNVAAIELVDYVVIDTHAEPLSIIQAVEPEIFVKGYEYSQHGTEKTRAERRAVESAGGRMLFSPGDFVLSSSAVIDSNPPDLSFEKLLMLMQVEKVSFDDLTSAIENPGDLRITILGDLIIDSTTETSVIGGFRKTPTASVRVDSHRQFVGGAGIVAKHMAEMGVHVELISVVGSDDAGKFALADLASAGVKYQIETLQERPTTHKNAVVADGYNLLRIDTVENRAVDEVVVNRIIDALRSCKSDAVVFSDFRHGIFNKETIPRYMTALPQEMFRVADSQVASRWGNILDFAGCDLITPNEEEVRFAMGDQDTVIRPLGSALYEKFGCEVLMLKVGSRGMLTYRPAARSLDRPAFFAVDSLVKGSAIDPVGAGDAMLAYGTVAYMATKSEVVAAIIGSLAAGLECEQQGNIPVTLIQMQDRIDELRSMADHS